MSEPFLERLSRFTPDAGGLDRDALLFAAGRASARPGHGWKIAAAVLAGTQALSLALLCLPYAAPPSHDSLPQSAQQAVPPTPAPPSDALVSSGVWAAHRDPLETVAEERPDESIDIVESGPPLRAFAPPPPSILN
jgi:hypothetical protein